VANVNAVATVDDDGGVSVFVVNRSLTEPVSLRLDVAALGAGAALVESHLLHEDDHYAANTLDGPERVGVRPVDGARLDEGALVADLPPVSWAAFRIA